MDKKVTKTCKRFKPPKTVYGVNAESEYAEAWMDLDADVYNLRPENGATVYIYTLAEKAKMVDGKLVRKPKKVV